MQVLVIFCFRGIQTVLKQQKKSDFVLINILSTSAGKVRVCLLDRTGEYLKINLGYFYSKIWLILNKLVVSVSQTVKYTCCYIIVCSLCFFHCSLRLALLNEAKEVRAAGLRALRYLIRDSSILQKVLKLKVDYLIAR